MLTDHLPHGDGQIAFSLLSELARRGHQVYAVTPRLEVRGHIHGNLHIKVLETPGGALGRLLFMAKMRAYYQELSRTVQFDLMHQLNPVFTGVSLAMLGSGLPQVLGAYFGQWPSDPETITGGKGWKATLAGKAQRAIATLQQRAADLLVLTGPNAAERLPSPKAAEGKVRMLGLGTDTAFFSPAADYLSERRFEAEQQNPAVLFLANVSLRKGIVPLVHAWKQVVAEIPNAKLTVAGLGPDLATMRSLAAEVGVADNIRFHGQQKREETPLFFRDHALYVLPSFGEPYGLALQEAMSCGRPVISTAAGGPKTLVQPESGLLVPMGDADALARAIVVMLRDPAMRREMAAANRKRALETMSWPAIVEVLEGYYAELLPAFEASAATPASFPWAA